MAGVAKTGGRSQHTSRLAGANTRTPRGEDEEDGKEEEWEDEEEGEGGEEEEEAEEEEEGEVEEEEGRATSAWHDSRIRPYTIFTCREVPSRATPDIPPQAAVMLDV